MVTKELVSADKELGAKLAELLHKDRELQPSTAMWKYNDEAEEWRFVVATRLVNEKSPGAAFTRINELAHPLQMPVDMAFSRLVVADPSDPELSALELVGLKRDLTGKSFGERGWGGVIIPAVHVYYSAACPIRNEHIGMLALRARLAFGVRVLRRAQPLYYHDDSRFVDLIERALGIIEATAAGESVGVPPSVHHVIDVNPSAVPGAEQVAHATKGMLDAVSTFERFPKSQIMLDEKVWNKMALIQDGEAKHLSPLLSDQVFKATELALEAIGIRATDVADAKLKAAEAGQRDFRVLAKYDPQYPYDLGPPVKFSELGERWPEGSPEFT